MLVEECIFEEKFCYICIRKEKKLGGILTCKTNIYNPNESKI